MFSHFRLQELWGNSSLAAVWQPQMRKTPAGIVNVTTTPLCLSIINIFHYHIVVLALLILLVVALMVVEYMLFLIPVVLAAVAIAAVPAALFWC